MNRRSSSNLLYKKEQDYTVEFAYKKAFLRCLQYKEGGKAYVFANTGSTAGLSSGYMYINTASSDGKTGNVRLMYDDTVIGLMYLDSEGYFSYGETYYEGVEY